MVDERTTTRLALATRKPRLVEIYSLDCHACGRGVEIEARQVRDSRAACPRCATALRIEWAAGAA
jgi:hypothetical protein